MEKFNNPIANKIYIILNPLVGDMMTCGILKTQAKKIGCTEETFLSQHLPAIAEGVERGLIVLLGSEVAKRIGNRIRSIS